MEQRATGRKQKYIPVPGERGRAVQLSPDLRASDAEILRRTASTQDSPNSPAYTEAVRLLKFLDYIVALQPGEISAIPPTSIMREFIGGQTLTRD